MIYTSAAAWPYSTQKLLIDSLFSLGLTFHCNAAPPNLTASHQIYLVLQAALVNNGITGTSAALDSSAAQSSVTHSGKKLSGGDIAGIVIGCVVGVALIAAVAFFILRRRQRTCRALLWLSLPASY